MGFLLHSRPLPPFSFVEYPKKKYMVCFAFWAHKNMLCHQKDFMLILSRMPKISHSNSSHRSFPNYFVTNGNDMKWFTMSLHGKPCITGGSNWLGAPV